MGQLKSSLKIVSFDMNGTLTEDRFIELIWGEGVPRLYSKTKNIPFEQAKEYVFQEYEKIGEGRTEWYDIKYWFRFFGLGEGWRELLKSFCRISDGALKKWTFLRLMKPSHPSSWS